MKILCTLLLSLAFISCIYAQSKTLEELQNQNKSFKKHRCKIDYDKFKDTTLVVSDLGGTNLPITTVRATFSFNGQTLNEPIKSYLVAFTTVSIMRDTSLIFIANGERVKIGEALSRNDRTRLMGLADAYMHIYEFTPEQLEKFVSSEKTEFQIGNLELKIQKDVSEKIKNLIILSKLN